MRSALIAALLIAASNVAVDSAAAAKRRPATSDLESLYNYCRHAVFRKYGDKHGDGYIYIGSMLASG